jgi:predicted nucleotidyltransferase
MGRNFARRARAAARKREQAIDQRRVAAMEQIEMLVQRFKEEDPHLRAIVLFGSLAAGTPVNPNFDIDLAVDSDKYWELLGIALDQPIPVDLVDLQRAARHIQSRIEAEGRWLYGHE